MSAFVEGDQVIHVKTGRVGVVKDPDWKGTGQVRVQHGGRQTVFSSKSLRKASAMTEREEELSRQRIAARRANTPPYDLMAEAVEHFKSEFPDADKVKPGWYGGRVYCEIWKQNCAKVVFY